MKAVFQETIVINPTDASKHCEEGPDMVSQSVLALINNSPACVKQTPSYWPSSSAVGDLLTSLAGKQLENTPPATAHASSDAAATSAKPASPAHPVAKSTSSSASANTVHFPEPAGGTTGHVSSEATATAAAHDPAQGQGSLPKRKKGTLGSEEKKLARAAAIAKSTRITEAVRTFVEQTEELVKGVADAEGISEECVCQLAGQVSAIKNKKAPSSWNILAHFKGQELNEGHPAQVKLQLGEIQNAIYEDEDMMDILHSNDEHMQELCQQYNNEKNEEQKAAKIEQLNERTGAWCFRVIGQSSYSSMVQSGFFGRGNIDGFMWKHFSVSVQELVCLFEDYACTTTTLASKKMDTAKMRTAVVELTVNALFHSVMIEGWPTDVPFAPPSMVNIAFQVKTLYNAWKLGEAHWRAMSAAEKRTVWDEALPDNEDEDEDKDDEAEYCPKKKGCAKKGGNDEDCPKVEKGKAPRKRKAPTGNDNMEGPRKKKHQSAKSSAKSVEKGAYVFGPAGVANKSAKKVVKKVLGLSVHTAQV